MRGARLSCFAVCVGLATATLSGCIDAIESAVVDDVTDPGGTLSVQIGDAAPGSLPALASGDPMAITAQSASLVVALSCTADVNGLHAATVLATAGATMTLPIAAGNGNQLQVHTGGQSYVADVGTIVLGTNADGTLSGTFDSTGTIAATGAPVTLHGTLTEIPQAH